MNILLVLLLLVPLSVNAGVMNFTVSPAIIKFEAAQGSTKSFDLSFFNQGKETLDVSVEVMNLTVDRDGVPRISVASRKPNQWARYVELNQNHFRVGAGASQQVHVTLKTPRGKPGGGYFAVTFNAIEVSDNKKRTRRGYNAMRIGGQLPTLFIGEIARTGVRKGRIENAQLNKGPYTETRPMKFRYLLVNEGTTHMNATGDILIRSNRKVVDRIKMEGGSGLILPNKGRYFLGSWPRAYEFSGKKLLVDARFSYQGGRVSKKLAITVP